MRGFWKFINTNLISGLILIFVASVAAVGVAVVISIVLVKYFGIGAI